MSPAGTAVGRDMLVANLGQEVVATDVVPDPLGGDAVIMNEGSLDDVVTTDTFNISGHCVADEPASLRSGGQKAGN